MRPTAPRSASSKGLPRSRALSHAGRWCCTAAAAAAAVAVATSPPPPAPKPPPPPLPPLLGLAALAATAANDSFGNDFLVRRGDEPARRRDGPFGSICVIRRRVGELVFGLLPDDDDDDDDDEERGGGGGGESAAAAEAEAPASPPSLPSLLWSMLMLAVSPPLLPLLLRVDE